MRTQFMCLTKHPLGFMNWQCVSAMSRCRAKQQQPNKPIISSFEIQFSGACTICLEPNSVAVSYFLQQLSRKEDSQGSKQVKNGKESARGTNLDACSFIGGFLICCDLKMLIFTETRCLYIHNWLCCSFHMLNPAAVSSRRGKSAELDAALIWILICSGDVRHQDLN